MLVKLKDDGPRSWSAGPKYRYVKGSVYEVEDEHGQQLLATGKFEIGSMPTVNKDAERKRDKAAAVIEMLAGMPEDFLDKLLRMGTAEQAELAATATPTVAPPAEEKAPKTAAKTKAKSKSKTKKSLSDLKD